MYPPSWAVRALPPIPAFRRLSLDRRHGPRRAGQVYEPPAGFEPASGWRDPELVVGIEPTFSRLQGECMVQRMLHQQTLAFFIFERWSTPQGNRTPISGSVDRRRFHWTSEAKRHTSRLLVLQPSPRGRTALPAAMPDIVETIGFEPMAFGVPRRRSTY